MEIDSAQDSIYQGQTFQLKFKFTDRYPFDSPSVTFIGREIPEHKWDYHIKVENEFYSNDILSLFRHIYSNGHICLSILSDDWTPALSVHAVCLSILSMLSKAEKKERPPDDMVYTRTCNSNPKRTKWMFHDDTV